MERVSTVEADYSRCNYDLKITVGRGKKDRHSDRSGRGKGKYVYSLENRVCSGEER